MADIITEVFSDLGDSDVKIQRLIKETKINPDRSEGVVGERSRKRRRGLSDGEEGTRGKGKEDLVIMKEELEKEELLLVGLRRKERGKALIMILAAARTKLLLNLL